MTVIHKPREYFDKYPQTPVTWREFDVHDLAIAEDFCCKLNTLLGPYQVKAELFGSLALGIAGKGEPEFVIYLDNNTWQPVLEYLIDIYGQPITIKEERVRFVVIDNEVEVEIVLKRGSQAELGKKLMSHFLQHPELIEEYEALKRRHAYSEREYHYHKRNYLTNLTESLSKS